MFYQSYMVHRYQLQPCLNHVCRFTVYCLVVIKDFRGMTHSVDNSSAECSVITSKTYSCSILIHQLHIKSTGHTSISCNSTAERSERPVSSTSFRYKRGVDLFLDDDVVRPEPPFPRQLAIVEVVHRIVVLPEEPGGVVHVAFVGVRANL